MPNHKNPWSEPPDHGIGRSRGGLTTKLHLVCDGRGRPLSMMITAGNINDTTMMSAVLENIRVPRDGKGRPRTRPDRVLADKGYPSRANRAWLRDRRIAATIPESAAAQTRALRTTSTKNSVRTGMAATSVERSQLPKGS